MGYLPYPYSVRVEGSKASKPGASMTDPMLSSNVTSSSSYTTASALQTSAHMPHPMHFDLSMVAMSGTA